MLLVAVAQLAEGTVTPAENRAALGNGERLLRGLQRVDLDIRESDYLAIMGASGSGKSTLMNILGCLDPPSSGTYHLDGVDLSRMEDDELSRIRGSRIGFIFQAFNLISELDIVENVGIPLFYFIVLLANLTRIREEHDTASISLEKGAAAGAKRLSAGADKFEAVHAAGKAAKKCLAKPEDIRQVCDFAGAMYETQHAKTGKLAVH